VSVPKKRTEPHGRVPRYDELSASVRLVSLQGSRQLYISNASKRRSRHRRGPSVVWITKRKTVTVTIPQELYESRSRPIRWTSRKSLRRKTTTAHPRRSGASPLEPHAAPSWGRDLCMNGWRMHKQASNCHRRVGCETRIMRSMQY
jgi:hypothetical protein